MTGVVVCIVGNCVGSLGDVLSTVLPNWGNKNVQSRMQTTARQRLMIRNTLRMLTILSVCINIKVAPILLDGCGITYHDGLA